MTIAACWAWGWKGLAGSTVVEGNLFVHNSLRTISDDQGARISGNTVCQGTIEVVHATVRDNPMTCEGIDVAAEAKKRATGTPALGPTRAPKPAPTNLRIRPVP